MILSDDSLHHPTLNYSPDISLDTTVNSVDPAVQSGGFKKVVELMQQRTLSDDGKYYLLTSHFNPDRTYRFPSYEYGKQKRSFQHSWLSHYNGLVYSVSGKGGYCKYCVLFGRAVVVYRAFQPSWFSRWKWIHYDSAQDLCFCHTCIMALKTGKIKLSGNARDSTFLSAGFSNWKEATVGFTNHEKSHNA